MIPTRMAGTVLALILVMISTSVSAGESRGTVTFANALPSEIMERPVHYTLYLPPAYESDRRLYPVIYMLHGGGSGSPADWFTLAGVGGVLDRLIAEGAIPPVIAVAPDGRRDAENIVATYFMNDSDGSNRWEDMFHEDFVPAIELRHRALATDGSRALLGISMGGVAATLYQLRHPETWAGASALSAAFRTPEEIMALSPEAYGVRYGGWFGAGLEGEGRLNDEWEANEVGTILEDLDISAFRRVPRLYFDTGSEDPFFAGLAQWHLALNAAGVKHRFRIREGNHDWPYWRAGLEEALLHLSSVLTRDYGE